MQKDIKITKYEAQDRLEGTLVKLGLNRTKANKDQNGNKSGRDHYIFREVKDGIKRHFVFCVDYNGYINSIEIQEWID